VELPRDAAGPAGLPQPGGRGGGRGGGAGRAQPRQTITGIVPERREGESGDRGARPTLLAGGHKEMLYLG
jgi:hypothetical protein